MISKILDPRAVPFQVVLFIFALAYFYCGISFSPSLAFPMKLFFGGGFFIGLLVTHLLLVKERDLVYPLRGIVYGFITGTVLTVFVLAGSILFIIPGILLFLLLLPIPALSAQKHLLPAEATLLHLREIKGRVIKELGYRFVFHGILLTGFLLFFSAGILLLAHGELKTAFLSLTRPSMIHEFLGLLYLILILPIYTAFIKKILRIS